MPIPVILDTDIGTDIDDTWALGFLLKSPELDLKLVSCATMNTIDRAKIVAKFLEITGRSDIPIAIGKCLDNAPLRQSPWIENYNLDNYPGKVYNDAPAAINEIISSSPEPVTIIAIGPLPNIASFATNYPDTASKARFIGMHGSVYKGYNGSSDVNAEYNVAHDAESAKTVFTTPWEMTITPLDTCGLIYLDGIEYSKMTNSDDIIAKTIIDNYHVWLGGHEDNGRSSTLYDTVAVYLAFDEELTKIEDINIKVTDDGFTIPDANGKSIRCATEWNDINKFKNLLVKRLTGNK